jgi:ADP-ribose pyrophosphatase YjhB (NUDIX family)
VGVLDSWRFCPRCGESLTRAGDGHVVCARGHEHWANAIPGVQGVLERDGRVLLALRAIEPRRGYWDLPGGLVDETEGPENALRREFLEETGLDVALGAFLGVRIEPYGERHVFSLTWTVHAEGTPVAADDVAELRWFAPDEIPEMAFPGQDVVLAAWVARQQHA